MDEKRRHLICHLTSAHPRYDVRIYYKMCKSLAEAGYPVLLVVADGKGDEIICDVRITDVGKPKNRLGRILFKSWQVAKRGLKEDASFYHFHDPEIIPAGLWLKFLGKKVIYDRHEDIVADIRTRTWIPDLLRNPLSAMVRFMEYWSAQHFHYIVGAIPSYADKFKKINANAVCIRNFPLLSEFENNATERDCQDGGFAYIGGLSEVRGIFEMLQAAHISNSRIRIAGSWESSNLRDRIRGVKLWEEVEYHGFVGRDEVREILRRSTGGIVCLHPTPKHLDSLPVKMFEYMAMGLPFIASDFPYWRKLLKGVGCCIFVDPLNPKEIAEAMQWLKDNPKDAKRMGQEGRKAISNRFNWSVEEAKLLQIYDET